MSTPDQPEPSPELEQHLNRATRNVRELAKDYSINDARGGYFYSKCMDANRHDQEAVFWLRREVAIGQEVDSLVVVLLHIDARSGSVDPESGLVVASLPLETDWRFTRSSTRFNTSLKPNAADWLATFTSPSVNRAYEYPLREVSPGEFTQYLRGLAEPNRGSSSEDTSQHWTDL